jgi:hypothetical protein
MREEHPQTLDAFRHQSLRKGFRRVVAGLIPIVRNEHALHAVGSERRQVLLRKPIHPVARRDVAQAGAPKRQRIDQRFAQDDFFAGG